MTRQELSKATSTWPSWVAMIVGIILVLLSALADPLGLGKSPGFGWRHTLGIIAGILSIFLGLRWRGRVRDSG